MARARLPALDQLAQLGFDELKRSWASVFVGAPPSRMPRDFLVKLLAQGLQERGAGGIPKALERALGKPCSSGGKVSSSESPDNLTLGTRLIRSWGDANHEVIVIESGFAYRGKSYRSLSEIAREITGARWSGPRFFGIKRGERAGHSLEKQA